MQSRLSSACEAAANVAIGYAVSAVLTWWLFGVTPRRAAGVSAVFTCASLARSYTVRRAFARWG